jgi:hypothetical protein
MLVGHGRARDGGLRPRRARRRAEARTADPMRDYMRPARPSAPDPAGGQGLLTVDICRKCTIIGLPLYIAARLVLVALSLTSLSARGM